MADVMTVSGPVDAAELGPVLTHEHLFVNLTSEIRIGGLLNDFGLMLEEVAAFADAGGRTLVDVSTRGLLDGAAPDPGAALAGLEVPQGTAATSAFEAMKVISAQTGVNIVAATGHYRDPHLDCDWFDRHSVDDIAAMMVSDIERGIGDTGVRPGIIGEIGTDRWYASAAEERSFRAAARAHLQTGLTITTHAARWPVGLAQLDLLCSEGVDPGRVIIGHSDHMNIPKYHEELARRGAWVQFDTIRGKWPRDTALRVGYVKNLVENGFADRILLSHDVCRTEHLRAYGGGGYTYVHTRFAELLVDAGIPDECVRQILTINPQRALAGTDEVDSAQ